MIVFDPTLYDPAKAVTVNPKRADHPSALAIATTAWSFPAPAGPHSAKGRFPEATSGTYDYLFRGGKYPDYFSNIHYGPVQPRARHRLSTEARKLLSAPAADASSLVSASATRCSSAAIRRSSPRLT